MAIYRNIKPSFWSDSKILETFTPEDKYFYLYLLTNPNTNLLGCYELSIKQASYDLGYNEDVVKHLLTRMSKTHKVIEYDYETKEVLILNWSKYNWSNSPKLTVAIEKFLDNVKNTHFKAFLVGIYNERDTVSIPYTYPIHTPITIPITNTITINDLKTKKYGEFKNVLLSQDEFKKLSENYPKIYEDYIERLSIYIKQKGKKYKSHYATILSWMRKDKKEVEEPDEKTESEFYSDWGVERL